MVSVASASGSCPVCHSTSVETVDRTNNYTLLLCKSCLLIFKQLARLDRDVVQELQDSIYTTNNLRGRISNNAFRSMAVDRLRYLKGFVREGSLLEIGPATGEFLQVASKEGFSVLGLEASSLFYEYLNSLGIPVRHGRLDDLQPENLFDIVVLFHLIEHIEEPHSFIERLADFVRDEGMIFIVTPNLESVTNRLFGYKHRDFVEADHLFIYSNKSLSTLLGHYGFASVASCTNEYPQHLFSSLRGYFTYQIDGFSQQYPRYSFVARVARSIAIRLTPPQLLGQMTLPLNYIYRWQIVKEGKGHELWLVCKKIPGKGKP